MRQTVVVENISKIFTLADANTRWYHLLKPKTNEKIAVDNINFTLRQGDFVAFLGPNGAGKSTTIKMLTGILTPTSGKILVNGIEPYVQRSAHARNIGVVFGQRTQLWWDLPPQDSFALLAKMYAIPAKQYHDNLAYFIDILGLRDFLHVPVRKLSLGQKMRCELAASLLHEPAILFLDEPTIGLDLFAKEAIRKFLQQINLTRKTTILLTTHDLDDVENLCEKIIIIDHGKIIKQDSLANLKADFSNEKTLAFKIAASASLIVPAGCRLVRNEGNVYYLAYSERKTPEVIQEMLATHVVHDIEFVNTDITEIIRRAYES